MYHYRMYGLSVASEVVFPELQLVVGADGDDVCISLGDVDFDLLSHPQTQNPGEKWHYCLPDRERLFFRCDGIDFAVIGGKTITIDTHGLSYDEAKLRIYLLGTAMGGIHMQRGNLPVHGAAVEGANGVTIITGSSGAGKSAILGALTQMGYRYLADDVSIVTIQGDVPMVLPAYPQRKIAVETARELGYDIGDLEIVNEDGREKYIVRRAREWSPEPMPLKALVEVAALQRKDGGAFSPELTEVTGHASLALVLRNLYRGSFYGAIGVEPGRMKKLLVLTSGIRCAQMIRPEEGFPVMQTAKFLLQSDLPTGV